MNALQLIASGICVVAALWLPVRAFLAACSVADVAPPPPPDDLWDGVDQRRIDAIRQLGREGTP